MPSKRELELVVISDTHLGTYGCHAKELLNYLKSIRPQTLILNGDIIDIWNFRKSYFPKSHIDGHIHKQQNKEIVSPHGSVTYLNSGDWVENLSSLEYDQGQWKIYQYNEEISTDIFDDELVPLNFEMQILAPFN